jgi:hypothetical protein
VRVDSGAEEDVRFRLSARAFSQWDSELGDWATIPGAHRIAIGRSSRDLCLTAMLGDLGG